MSALAGTKEFVLRLFWVRRFDGMAREQAGARWKFLRWVARLALIVYLAGLTLNVVQLVLRLSLQALNGLALAAVLIPLVCRLVIGMQISLGRIVTPSSRRRR